MAAPAQGQAVLVLPSPLARAGRTAFLLSLQPLRTQSSLFCSGKVRPFKSQPNCRFTLSAHLSAARACLLDGCLPSSLGSGAGRAAGRLWEGCRRSRSTTTTQGHTTVRAWAAPSRLPPCHRRRASPASFVTAAETSRNFRPRAKMPVGGAGGGGPPYVWGQDIPKCRPRSCGF